ncbi:MAG: 3-methyl-2-oxobutanoate hydroxymethyltransferase [Candidatus Aminicenantia bacterium]
MEKITIKTIIEKKRRGEKISALTAYDYSTALIVDKTGIDIILVGDSLGNVILGYESTIPVTMDDMRYHVRAVARARKRALLIADMPYMSFHISPQETVRNASLFMRDGAEGVKIEGGKKRIEMIKALINAEIPVMGHIGLTPQSIYMFGGYKVQGKDYETAKALIEDALLLEEAGVFSIVLESVPEEISKIITKKIKIPTIGIGAGPNCDGQILVFHDLLGLTPGYLPKFVRKYLELERLIDSAIKAYIKDISEVKFPDENESYHLPDEVKEKLEREYGDFLKD